MTVPVHKRTIVLSAQFVRFGPGADYEHRMDAGTSFRCDQELKNLETTWSTLNILQEQLALCCDVEFLIYV
jgi:hypothetical protein